MCELSLEKLLSYCRSLLQKKSTPSFPALKHCALPNGDNIGDSHSNSSVPEEPPQGSFPQALQGGRQAAAADLAEKQGRHFSAKAQKVLDAAVLCCLSQSSPIPAITPHLATPGAWRLCLSGFALKSHFRNCLPRPRTAMKTRLSPGKGITPSTWHPGGITSLKNPGGL